MSTRTLIWGAVLAASRTVGSVLSAGDVVIYESTVYPGATDEECVHSLQFEVRRSRGRTKEAVNTAAGHG